MEIFAVGTDILNIKRIEALSGDYNDPFFRRVFTQREYDQAMGRPVPYLNFSTKFAVKEAVYKALGDDSGGFIPRLIEVLNCEGDGAPYVTFHGDMAEHIRKKGIVEVKVSASYDADYATAFAVSIRG